MSSKNIQVKGYFLNGWGHSNIVKIINGINSEVWFIKINFKKIKRIKKEDKIKKIGKV